LVPVDPSATSVCVVLSVIAISAGGSADFHIQWSLDNIVWAESSPPDKFDTITAPTAVVQQFNVKGKYWRAVCNLAGPTPSVTGSANSYS
jgi:hypothetical protein